MFFYVLATFAEFEGDLIRLRTRGRIAIARAKGKLKDKQSKHVFFLQSRCLLKKSCSPQELKKTMDMDKIKNIREKSKTVHRYEIGKNFPDRFPYNADSIGVEIVGKAERIKNEDVYEPVNDRQNESLKWLIKELSETLSVSLNEVYRHPDVGRKNATEASTAKW